VDTLHAILTHKIEMIEKLKFRVEEFSLNLEEEERLAIQFKQLQHSDDE